MTMPDQIIPTTSPRIPATPDRGPSDPLIRFGVIADPQYAAIPPSPDMDRYYAASLGKLSEAIATFNDAPLQFVVTLGDIIDRDFDSYADILPLYETLRHRHFFLLGNHDFAVSSEFLPSIRHRVGLERSYYDFHAEGYCFVLLDGNDVSLYAPPVGDPRRDIAAARIGALQVLGADNAQRWNGSLSDEQFAWLEATLAEAATAGERVIVMNHHPVFPENAHNMWDSERVLELLSRAPHVVAYLNGHNHAGNFGLLDGTYFVNFKGMVDSAATNAYAIVAVYEDRIEIEGFGRETSRTLPLPAMADAG